MIESSTAIFTYLFATARLTPGHFCHRQTAVVTPDGPLLHAVDQTKGSILLVPVSDNFAELFPWSSKSLVLNDKQLKIDGKVSRFIELSCMDKHLSRQFGLLVDDVLEAVSTNVQNAGRSTVSVVERWRSLFERTRPDSLGESAIIGLWGELKFLEEITVGKGPELVQSWYGPFKERHDFVFSTESVEVKTTIGGGSFRVAIHGARQLQAPLGADLVLRAYRLEKNLNGISVPDLIDSLLGLGVSRIELMTRLSEVGYFDADSPLYKKHKYTVTDVKNIVVDENFPRIVPETLIVPAFMDSIPRLEYIVELGNLKTVELDLTTLELEV